METLQVTDLHYTYPATEGEAVTDIFQGLDLTIPHGSFVAILGHNGCGKSTLAKHFNAILLPSGGSVQVYGMDTRDEALLLEIRRSVGMVFQNPDNQIVATVVEEDVAFGLENLGVEPHEIQRRVYQALKAVNMTEYATHAPHMLSGGQKQRVAIAGVLAMKPEVILMDEPTAMLDPSGRREVMETVERLHKEEGMTVVLITHFMDEALRGDRVAVMEKGQIVLEGAPRQVFAQVDELKRIGLDVPPMMELSQRLKKDGYDVGCEPMTVEEMVEALCRLKQKN